MRKLDSMITHTARRWRISPALARVLFWAPLVGAVAMALARLHKPLFRMLLTEDGPVEWGQFACFAAAMVFGFAVAIRLFRDRRPWQAALYAMFAAMMLFCTGEEVAWGQRVLDLKTPENLRVINKQQEITLHNIGEALSFFKLVMMLGAAVAAVAYWVNRRLRIERFAPDADYLFVPPPFLAPTFLIVFCYYAFRFTLWRESGFTITKYGEWAEFCLALGLAMFAWLNHHRLGQPTATADATAPGPAVVDRRQSRQPIGSTK